MFNDPDHVPHGSIRRMVALPLDVPEWEWSTHPILRRAVIEPDGAIVWQLGPCAPQVMEECVAAVSRVSFRRNSGGTLVARLHAPINQDWFAESDADDFDDDVEASAAPGLESAESGRAGRPVLYLDMDNTLVDFASAFAQVDPRMLRADEDDCDDIPGIFAFMRPMPGAIEAVHTLSERYDVYVLSTAPWNNPSAWGDKVRWIQRHFGSEPGSVLYKRLILSHHKELNGGAILVDDRPEHNGAGDFDGILVPFGSPRFPDWASVVSWLMRADVAPAATDVQTPASR